MKPNDKGYLIKIYWSDEDEAYVAEVPSLPGCAGHGDTYTEALESVSISMELWLEAAKEFNDPIPTPDLARARIEEIGPLLNLTELSRRTGIKRTTLASKLRRNTPFTAEEGRAIKEVLESV